MQIVIKIHGLEMQCGFQSAVGTTDGSYTATTALRKRKEHGLETWALFIDLVKAFDTVPRGALFKILRKFGLPAHMVNIIIRLHTDAMNFLAADIEAVVDSLIHRRGTAGQH